jgi:hypothetical protein
LTLVPASVQEHLQKHGLIQPVGNQAETGNPATVNSRLQPGLGYFQNWIPIPDKGNCLHAEPYFDSLNADGR